VQIFIFAQFRSSSKIKPQKICTVLLSHWRWEWGAVKDINKKAQEVTPFNFLWFQKYFVMISNTITFFISILCYCCHWIGFDVISSSVIQFNRTTNSFKALVNQRQIFLEQVVKTGSSTHHNQKPQSKYYDLCFMIWTFLIQFNKPPLFQKQNQKPYKIVVTLTFIFLQNTRWIRIRIRIPKNLISLHPGQEFELEYWRSYLMTGLIT
jgi:hypothetical protein